MLIHGKRTVQNGDGQWNKDREYPDKSIDMQRIGKIERRHSSSQRNEEKGLALKESKTTF